MDGVDHVHSAVWTDSVTTSGASFDVDLGFTPNMVIAYGPEKKKEENMRSLFRITVVNPKTEKVTEYLPVIARDEANAVLKTNLTEATRLNIDDYDILVEIVGDVRAKKDIQKVEVVEGDK